MKRLVLTTAWVATQAEFKKIKWAYFALSLLATGIILLATSKYGAGLTPDSVGYVALARNLIAGQGYTSIHGTPWVAQPPLFTVLIALISIVVRQDVLHFVHIVNAVLFGGIVYLSGLLADRYFSSKLLALLATISVLISKPLTYVSTQALTEPLFIILLLLFLIFAWEYLQTSKSMNFFGMAVLAGLASLTRYAGAALIFTGAAIVLFATWPNYKKTIQQIFLFGGVASVPFSGWFVRNWVVVGTILGADQRSSPPFYPYFNLIETVETLLSWYLPYFQIHDLILSSTFVGFSFVWRQKFWQRVKSFLIPVDPIRLFIFFFSVFMWISVQREMVRMEPRFLFALYIPLTFLLFKGFEKLIQKLEVRYSSKIANGILVILFAIWSIFPISSLIFRTQTQLAEGAGGYNTDLWRQSETLHYLSQLELQANTTVYSNSYDAIYVLTDIQAKKSPQKIYDAPPPITDAERIAQGTWPETSQAYLVWFFQNNRAAIYTLGELLELVEMERVGEFDDGKIFRIWTLP